AKRGLVLVRDTPVELGEPDEGVVGPIDRSVLVGNADRVEVVDDTLLDARRVVLLVRVALLRVRADEVEQTVGYELPAERESRLPPVEVELVGGPAGRLGSLGRETVVLVV